MRTLFAVLISLILSACGDSSRVTAAVSAPPASTSVTVGESAAPVGNTNSPGSQVIPPVASLTNGVWMKGDIHIHSRHSNDSTNNPVAKIIALGEAVGMDFLAITDHNPGL